MTDYYKKGYLLMDNLSEDEEGEGLGTEMPEDDFFDKDEEVEETEEAENKEENFGDDEE